MERSNKRIFARRLIGSLLLMAFLLGLIFSLSHHCCGEDCPLCSPGGGWKETLLLLGISFVLLPILSDGEGSRADSFRFMGEKCGTPVQQKVKLSN